MSHRKIGKERQSLLKLMEEWDKMKLAADLIKRGQAVIKVESGRKKTVPQKKKYGTGINKEWTLGLDLLESWDRMKEGADLLKKGEAVIRNVDGVRKIVRRNKK